MLYIYMYISYLREYVRNIGGKIVYTPPHKNTATECIDLTSLPPTLPRCCVRSTNGSHGLASSVCAVWFGLLSTVCIQTRSLCAKHITPHRCWTLARTACSDCSWQHAEVILVVTQITTTRFRMCVVRCALVVLALRVESDGIFAHKSGPFCSARLWVILLMLLLVMHERSD